jgi:hypothetical protein
MTEMAISPEYWLERAREIRNRAGTMHDEALRREILAIAYHYELLAAYQDTKRSSPKAQANLGVSP